MIIALAKALAALPEGCKVQTLNLAGNGMGSEAVCAICPVIAQYTACLSVINLSGNRLGAHGCTVLAAALAGNIKLDELYLSGCTIDDKCAGVIMPAIGARPRPGRPCARTHPRPPVLEPSGCPTPAPIPRPQHP